VKNHILNNIVKRHGNNLEAATTACVADVHQSDLQWSHASVQTPVEIFIRNSEVHQSDLNLSEASSQSPPMSSVAYSGFHLGSSSAPAVSVMSMAKDA
jgi:hypothetical protein